MNYDCIIIGGGAAGLAAAAYLSRYSIQVLLIERLDRVGKKILSTGNGRCNFSNREMSAKNYGNKHEFIKKLFKTTSPSEVLDFLASLGLMFREESGRLYPRTMAASSVLDVFRNALQKDNIQTMLQEKAVLITNKNGLWQVKTESKHEYIAKYLIVCTGGKAAPKMGTDGSAFNMIENLGHCITPIVPALVQLRCSSSILPSLRGLRIHAKVSLFVNKRYVNSEIGELLFTDYGLSGICVMQLSGNAADALREKAAVSLQIDMLPEIPDSYMISWFKDRLNSNSTNTVLSVFTGVFPRMLSQAILHEVAIPCTKIAAALTPLEVDALLNQIKRYSLQVTGTQGFDSAQVSRGGVSLDEIDPYTMESRLHPGLFFAGEDVDIDGPCGGYNLHFAFASGLTAAKSIVLNQYSEEV